MKRTKSYRSANRAILYLVATPIGNLNEVSGRTLDILKSADVIACEDTRTSGVLLSHYGIDTRTITYHNFNEDNSAKGIMDLLRQDKTVALISDAGYPLLSDPGFELVRRCRDEDIPVSTVSGANAAINALVASGLDTRHYLFYGFLSSKATAARKELEALKEFPYTLVFYEAPHRIIKTLELMEETLGNRNAVIARELTKLHEEYIEGTLSEFSELEELKGELVVVVEGYKKEESEPDFELLFEETDELIRQGYHSKKAIGEVSEKYGISKNVLYDRYHKRDKE